MNTLQPVERQVFQNPWFWAGILLGILVITRLVSGCDGLYGQDAYAHLNYARNLQAHWETGLGMSSYQWPRLYPFLGALWFWGNPGPWMQLLSMVGAAVMLAMVIKLLQFAQPGAKWLAPLAFLFVGLSPFLLRNSLTVMADTPSLALMSAALWLGERYRVLGNAGRLTGAAFLTGAAIFMRYPVALVMFLPALSWFWVAVKRRDWLGLALLPCGMIAALAQLLLPQAVGEGLGQPFQHQHFTQWSVAHFFQRSFVQKDGQNSYPVFNLLAAFGLFWHPRYLGLGFLGVVGFLFRKRLDLPKVNWVAVGAIAVNAFFLAGIPFQNPRFMLPVLPFAALLLVPIWSAVWERLPKVKGYRQVAWTILLIVQLGLGWWSCKLLFSVNANEKQIAADLIALPHAQQRLYELGFEAMLKAREVPMESVSMWTGPLEPPRKGDLILFNLPAFEVQFRAMWPMRNWEFLQRGHELETIREWKDGWTLYRIY